MQIWIWRSPAAACALPQLLPYLTFLSTLYIRNTLFGSVHTEFLLQKMVNCLVDLALKQSKGRVEFNSCPCSSPEVPNPHWHLGNLELPLVPAGRCFLLFQVVPPLQVVPVQEITKYQSSPLQIPNTLVGSSLTLGPVGPTTPLAPWSPVAPWKHINNQGHI